MQLASLEHTRVRTVREIFASSGCESAGALRFLASKCTAGNVALKSPVSLPIGWPSLDIWLACSTCFSDIDPSISWINVRRSFFHFYVIISCFPKECNGTGASRSNTLLNKEKRSNYGRSAVKRASKRSKKALIVAVQPEAWLRRQAV